MNILAAPAITLIWVTAMYTTAATAIYRLVVTAIYLTATTAIYQRTITGVMYFLPKADVLDDSEVELDLFDLVIDAGNLILE